MSCCDQWCRRHSQLSIHTSLPHFWFHVIFVPGFIEARWLVRPLLVASFSAAPADLCLDAELSPERA
ncbi:MAG: hypothetical protein WCO71_06405, partial [Pseudomonadota bacterium]